MTEYLYQAKDFLLTPPGKLVCALLLFGVAQRGKDLARVKAWLKADPLRTRFFVAALGLVPFGAYTASGAPIDDTLTTLATAVLGAMGLHSARSKKPEPEPAPAPEPKKRARRKCSICRQPGHTAKKCPEKDK